MDNTKLTNLDIRRKIGHFAPQWQYLGGVCVGGGGGGSESFTTTSTGTEALHCTC